MKIKSNIPLNHKSKEIGTYVLQNPETMETYVGSGVLSDRLRNHSRVLESGRLGKTDKKGKPIYHHNESLQQAYNRNPAFEFTAVVTDDRELAYDLEQEIINEHLGNSLFLNKSRNARNGDYEVTEKTRQKLRDRVFTEEHRNKIGLANSRREISEETKQKISLANTGRKHSEEAKIKISTAGVGRIFSEESRQKLSDSKRGWIPPENVIHNLQLANKNRSIPVYVDGIRYDSVNAAATAFNVDNNTVKARCNSSTGKFNNWIFGSNNDNS